MSLLPNIAILIRRGIVQIITNPLATPFNTSIELIVFPTIGIITKISGMDNRGMKTAPKIRYRCEPKAPRTIKGTAANINASGLNDPGITRLSSIRPIINPMTVVSRIAMIFTLNVSKNKIISDVAIPMSNVGPAGLGISGNSGLWKSFTIFPLEINDLIVLGIITTTNRNEMKETSIAWMSVLLSAGFSKYLSVLLIQKICYITATLNNK